MNKLDLIKASAFNETIKEAKGVSDWIADITNWWKGWWGGLDDKQRSAITRGLTGFGLGYGVPAMFGSRPGSSLLTGLLAGGLGAGSPYLFGGNSAQPSQQEGTPETATTTSDNSDEIKEYTERVRRPVWTEGKERVESNLPLKFKVYR